MPGAESALFDRRETSLGPETFSNNALPLGGVMLAYICACVKVSGVAVCGKTAGAARLPQKLSHPTRFRHLVITY